jgi:probable H4MPT-linked C1 transfer pathway protein
LLVDVGSTSTDVIPMVDGVPVPEGRTDLERLIASELLYTGISRTPVCAVVQKVPLLRISETSDKGDEVFVPVAAENFATALDVHLLNGDIPADERNLQTADGRPATRQGSLNRLAHLLCCDLTELDEEQLVHIAAYVADQQLEQISAVIRNRCAYLRRISNAGSATKIQILLSGSGSWLAEKAVVNIADSALASVSSLSDMFVRNVSSCAPAFAVARLASERCVDDLLPMEIF